MASTYVPKRMNFPQAMREVRAAGATYQGIWSWLTTVDHKRIGLMYGVSSFLFFVVGGIEALLIRVQLAAPEQDFLNPDQYNRMFTMHGTTMVFLVVMPMSAAFFNLLVPLMIGARDVAFPRMNALSFWLLPPAVLMLLGTPLGGGLDFGWNAYAPLSTQGAGVGKTMFVLAFLLGALRLLHAGFLVGIEQFEQFEIAGVHNGRADK